MSRLFDHYRPNQELLLYLPFREGTGTNTQDWAKPHHVCTLVGTPAWTIETNDKVTLDFDPANPDYVSIPAAGSADLNFTSGAFAGAAWINSDATGNRDIFNKGTAADGWTLWLAGPSSYIAFTTRQAGPTTQTSYSDAISLNTWNHVGFSRAGAAALIYINGVLSMTTYATHINPATAVAANFYVGVNDLAGAAWWDGQIVEAKVWNRAVAAAEFKALYEIERDLFGV